MPTFEELTVIFQGKQGNGPFYLINTHTEDERDTARAFEYNGSA